LVQGDSNFMPQSVTPIYGPDGNVKALVHSAGAIFPIQHSLYWTPGLGITVPSVLLSSTGSVIAGVGVGAGNLYLGLVGNVPATVHEIETTWLTGDVTTPGSNLNVGIIAPYRPPKPSLSLLFASRGLVGVPIEIPGIIGLFGLNPSLVLWLGTAPHFPNTGAATLSLSVPNDPTLRGVTLSIQALVLSGNGEFYLTNTASLAVK
jgi:hypothetical protein